MLRITYLLTLIIILLSAPASGQYLIRGQISDKENHKRLEHAAVTLVHLPDSILTTFTRTDSSGRFFLRPDTTGSYIMMISFPGFADFVDEVAVKDKQPVEIGTIPLASRINLMNEFIFQQRQGSIKLKGDTTEYAADSFKVHDNATVEDLLKKLPGLQVDKNGSITAQGEKVQKILVDGEEFFSDDPAVVTRNLDAKSVDKVQVFDKKSDEAAFTGIDDGQKTKTINLKLKEDRKKGLFGKVQAGGGTDGYYENQAMINAFKGKRQLSAFGIVANTGKMGLGWEDRSKYGSSGNNTEYDEETGDMYSYYNGGDNDNVNWQGTYNGEGLPSAWTGGLHYANKWDEDKLQLSGNYRYGKQNIDATGNVLTVYSLPPDSQFYRRQERRSFSQGERHSADGLFEWKIDTTSSLKATVNGGYKHTISNASYYTETRGSLSDTLINLSHRKLNSDATGKNLTSNIIYRKKFNKKGRSFFLSVNENYREGNTTSFLTSDNFYFLGANTADSVNQRKDIITKALSVDGNASYTEPLSKTAYLNVSYGLNINNANTSNLSYNHTPGGTWSDIPDAEYSSNYDFNVLTHKASARLRFVYKKYNFSVGSNAYFTSFGQHDLLSDTSVSRNYTNFAPSASFNYNFSKQKRLSLNYNGNTRQPTIDQIQPLKQNTDPLNVAIGNPLLKQEFRNTVNFNYNNYKVLTDHYTYVNGGVTFVSNAISQAQSTDGEGRRTYQYINVNGNYNGWFYAGTGKKLNKLDMHAGINTSIMLGHANSYINGEQNTSTNNTYSLSFNINKDWTKGDKPLAGISFEPGISYNDNKATISTATTSYWSANIEASVYAELPGKLRINSSVEVNMRERTGVFDRNNNVVRWDAYIARKLGKANKAEVRLSVFDILNQNIGYNRFGTDNYITENNYNTIRRYGMLSLVWNFTKMPKGSAPVNESGDD